MSQSDAREAFEKWVRTQDEETEIVRVGDEYKSDLVQAVWDCWQAARADFSKECERFHNEGHKCATCGRIDSKEIERRVQAARAEALREQLRKLSDASDDPEEMLEACAEIADLMDSDHTKAVSRLREIFEAVRVEAWREATSKIDKLPFMDSQGGGPLIYRSKVRATLAKLEEK